MDALVLVKPVPVVEEIEISSDSSDIKKDELKFFINESDSYALEEAILKKEQFGGTVTVVTLAEDNLEGQVNEMIWECYAKGADSGFFITTHETHLDVYSKSKVLSEFIKSKKFDLVLMGVQSSDTGYSLLGPLIAKSLNVPYSTLVSKLDLVDNKARINREMEEGYFETLEFPLPALFTIQTGINTPRYPPFIKIRNAKKIPITKMEVTSIVERPEDLVKLKRDKVYVPESKGGVKMLEGDPESVSKELAKLIKSLGVME